MSRKNDADTRNNARIRALCVEQGSSSGAPLTVSDLEASVNDITGVAQCLFGLAHLGDDTEISSDAVMFLARVVLQHARTLRTLVAKLRESENDGISERGLGS